MFRPPASPVYHPINSHRISTHEGEAMSSPRQSDPPQLSAQPCAHAQCSGCGKPNRLPMSQARMVKCTQMLTVQVQPMYPCTTQQWPASTFPVSWVEARCFVVNECGLQLNTLVRLMASDLIREYGMWIYGKIIECNEADCILEDVYCFFWGK